MYKSTNKPQVKTEQEKKKREIANLVPEVDQRRLNEFKISSAFTFCDSMKYYYSIDQRTRNIRN